MPDPACSVAFEIKDIDGKDCLRVEMAYGGKTYEWAIERAEDKMEARYEAAFLALSRVFKQLREAKCTAKESQ